MKTRSALLAGLVSAFCAFSPALHAADHPAPANAASPDEMPVERWANGMYLTGDWGGLRTRLEAKGVDFFAFYNTDTAGNPSGGVNPGNVTYTDDFFFGVNLYLEKLLGWKGARFYINGIRRDGHSLTNKYVGSIYNAQQDYGGQNIFLYDVDFEQMLFDDKFSIKAGRFSASDDFNNSPIYNLYMTNGIDGDVRNVLFDTQSSAYPFNTWAARVVYYPVKEIALKLGVFQTTTEVFNRERNGVDWSIQGDDGVILMGQVNWSPEFFKQAVAVPGKKTGSDGKDGKSSAASETRLEGLPGHYNIGGSYSPWKGFAEFGTGRLRASSYGVWAHADQMVYREQPGTNQGLTLWVAGAVYPQNDLSIIPYQAEGGFIYEGLLPSRDKDKLIFGFVYGKFSRNFANLTEDTGGGRPDYEAVFEGAYRLQLTKFFYFQPDIQYYNKPFGTGRIKDALIVGTHSGFVF